MQQAEADIRQMMEAFLQATPDKPGIPDAQTVLLRHRLIDEEVNKELLPAIEACDLPAIYDGCVDALVVIIGTMIAFGLPVAEGWKEVLRSNMAKVDPNTGKVIKREDGKVLKPEGWTAPDLAAIIAKHSN